MARHRQHPHADCRHGIAHPYRHPRHASGRAGDEKVCRSIELIIFVPLRNHKRHLTMASNPDFVQYIADQCAGAGEITVKKMFGDYGIYCDGVIFGLVCDNRFYLKPTEAGRSLLRSVEMRPPYDGAKDYFFIEDVDDRDYLSALVCETCKALPQPKSKKKKMK